MDLVGNQSDLILGQKIMSALMPMMTAIEQGGKFLQCIKLGCELQGRPGGMVRAPLLPMEDLLKQEMSRVFLSTHNTLKTIFKI